MEVSIDLGKGLHLGYDVTECDITGYDVNTDGCSTKVLVVEKEDLGVEYAMEYGCDVTAMGCDVTAIGCDVNGCSNAILEFEYPFVG